MDSCGCNGWTNPYPYVPTIPKLYLDAVSVEQQIKQCYCWLNSLNEYTLDVKETADKAKEEVDDAVTAIEKQTQTLTEYINNTIENLNEQFDVDINALKKEVETQLEEQNTLVEETLEAQDAHVKQSLIDFNDDWLLILNALTDTGIQWNPQHGYTCGSKEAQRDMFNDISVHSLSCSEIEKLDLTVEELSESGLNVAGWALLGYYFVQEFDIPPDYSYMGGSYGGTTLSATKLVNAKVNEAGFVYVPKE